MGEGVDEVTVGVLRQALQGHGTAGGRADQALQLIAAMRRNRRVGVQGKPVNTGAVRPREPGRLACGIVYPGVADNCLAQKPDKMSLFHTDVRGRCHGVAPVFLPVRTDRTRVAVLPAASNSRP